MDKDLFKYLFGIDPEELPENIIITPFFSPKRFQAYRGGMKISFRGALYSGAVFRTEGKEFAMITCGIGTALAGDSVIGLELTAVKTIIFIGSAGGLNGAKIGDIIVADSAYNGEGFTVYHDDKKQFGDVLEGAGRVSSDPVLSSGLEKLLDKDPSLREIVKKGKVFTIGSLTAETPENLKEIEHMGFLAVEMELSAVLQAAEKIHKSSAGVLFISDEPLEKPVWKEMEKEDVKKYNKGIDGVVKNVIDFFVSG